MLSTNNNLCETNIIGKGTFQSGVHWTECPGMLDRGIFSVGYARIAGPYHIVRLSPNFEHLTFCFQGSGKALIRGEWVPFGEGNIVLSPYSAPHGTLSDIRSSEVWGLSWIIFDRRRSFFPRMAVDEATLIPSGYPSPLALIEGLEQEVTSSKDAETIMLWVELMHRWVERLLSGRSVDDRLRRLWERVQEDISRPWTLGEMACVAGLSEGHLRRLCRMELGFSPRQQLARLRIRRVSVLLSTTSLTLQQITEEVGYSDPFALSTAFRRVTGKSPRDFRRSLWGISKPKQ